MSETLEALGDLMNPQPPKKQDGKKIETDKNLPEEPKKDINRNFTFRLSDSDRYILEKHFKEKGIINLSIGIRQMIADYMRENKLK